MSIPDHARYFHSLGVPVLPFKSVPQNGKKPSKKPLLGNFKTWGQWRTQPQTLQEMESLPWSEANGEEDGWFVVCGVKAKNGCYFIAFDRDCEDFNPDQLPITVFEQTPHNGYHAYYWSRVNHQGRKFNEQNWEFLGDGNLCGIYPVPHTGCNEYERIATVEDAWQIFIDLLEEGGHFQDAGEKINVPLLLEGSPEHGDEKHLPRDQAAIRLATYYRTKDETREECLRLLKEWDKRNRPPLGEVVLRAKVTQAFKNEVPYKWSFIESTSEVESLTDSLDKVPKNIAAIDKYLQDLKLRIMGADVTPEPYGSLEDLYDELLTYYQTGLSLDSLTPYLYSSYTLLTEQLPNLDFIFVIYITGLKGTGKSTAGDHLAAVCYQAFKTGCATFPFLVRANEVFSGMTQILDEFDLIADDDRVTKYIRGSTDRNNPYGVVEGVPINGQTYNLPAVKMSFGPRVLITSLQLKDSMARDRAVETIMMMNSDYMVKPTPEQVQKLRAHLAYYRQQVKIVITEADGEKWYQAKNSTGRLNEISTLLHVITPEKYHPQIDSIIDREWETRTQLERESYAAKVVEALTTAVVEKTTVESAKGEKYVPVQTIKLYYDQRYADQQTGEGKTSEKSIGRVMNNLALKTERVRLSKQDGGRQVKAWKLNVDTLRSKRLTLYLDSESLEPLESSPSAPLPLTKHLLIREEETVHTLANDSKYSNDSKQENNQP